MKIVMVKVNEIVPYEKNPRKNDKAVDIVARSIKEFGFLVPIILDEKNVIVAGHTRLKAAVKLNYTELPVIYAEGLTDEQIKVCYMMEIDPNYCSVIIERWEKLTNKKAINMTQSDKNGQKST